MKYMNSWKPEILVRDSTGATWNYVPKEFFDSDSMRFATELEATKAGELGLFAVQQFRRSIAGAATWARLGVPTRSRVVQSEEAVNYVFDDATGRPSLIDA